MSPTEPNGINSYYKSLPNGATQREFFKKTMTLTNASRPAVYSWLKKNTVPASSKDRQLIANLTGLTEAELFGEIPARRSGGRNRKAGGKVETV